MKRFYAIFDKKAGLYDHVQSFRSDPEAVRACKSLVNSSETGSRRSLVQQYPSDYELYFVGSFDEQQGCFVAEPPEFVVQLAVLVDETKEASNG